MERYEAYKDSGVEWIGEIPEGWKVCHAKWLVRISNGSDPNSEGEIPVYGSSGANFKTCGEFKRPPAVLLGRKGTIDSPSYIDHPYWNVDTAFDATAYDQSLSLRYYFYLSVCFDYLRYQTSTAIPSMTQSNYRNMNIPIPPATEQQAIADFLDAKTAEIDGFVADCEREVELLQEYRKAVISEAVTKGLDPHAPMKDSGVEWIGEIPEGWEAVRVDKVAIRKSGHTPNKTNPDYWNGKIVWISLADSPKLRNATYVSSSTAMTTPAGIAGSSAELLPAGSVLLSRDASVGLTAIAGIELAVSQHFMAYICGPKLNNEFLHFAFLAMHQELAKLSMGSTIPTIGLPLIRKLSIPLPQRTAQDEIVAYLDAKTAEIDWLIEAKQQMAEKLREYRKSLISEAVTGKFKVPGVA